MITIGFESSCDETSVAIFSEGSILSNIVYSQIPIHEKFGGVIPEIASRDHVKKIATITSTAIQEAGITIKDIDGVAVTNKPGLVGSLVVGLSFAKSFAYYNHKKFVGVDHLKAHLYSPFLEYDISYPFIALTISGGHTSITYVKAFNDEQLLGTTYDDAAGEAFDKIAKVLGLGYPGGPLIEKCALAGNPKAIKFPRPLTTNKNPEDLYNFSFSGLKSSVINYVRTNPAFCKEDVAASFQEALFETLIIKLNRAVKDTKCHNIVIAGGVACNKTLKTKFNNFFNQKTYSLFIPSPKYCTDNAAMVAYLGDKYLKMARYDDLELGVNSRI